jgi:short-subunit dehydrogenase
MSSKTSRSSGLAVVTGASSGIGAEVARILSRRGQPVLAIARRGDRLEALSTEARQSGAAPVHPLPLDVTAPGAAEQIRARARELGGAAWLVNDAGFGLLGSFWNHAPDRLRAMVRLNCQAMVALSAALLPDLLAAPAGVLLNVGSVAGFQPMPWFACYGATKAFVLSFSEALAEELRRSRVTVTAFCPGPVATEFGEVSGHADSTPGQLGVEAAACFAVAAADRGRVVAVPTALYRTLSKAGHVLPRAAVRAIGGWTMRSRARVAGDPPVSAPSHSPGVAVVTGASSGIGAAIARRLASRGTPVLAVARTAAALGLLSDEARASGWATIEPLPLDVTTDGAAAAIRDRTRALGGASWLVNAAGTMTFGRFPGDASRLLAEVQLDAEAPLLLTRTLGEEMVSRGSGRILNVASLAACQPTPIYAVYGGCKAFLLSFSEALSVELQGTGVTVTALCPGPVATPMLERAGPGVTRRPTPHDLTADQAAAAGLAAAEQGVPVVIPGAVNWALSVASRISPRALNRRISASLGMRYLGLPSDWPAG